MNNNHRITLNTNKNIIVEFTNGRIIPASGLTVVGALLGKSGFIKKLNRMDVTSNRSQHQIKNGDIVLTYLGMLFLPATEWEVYNEAIGSSFAGKGVRYHVFRYQNTSEIQKAVAWHRGRNMLVERKIDALLRDMDIAKGYEVNFNGEYQYFTLVKRGSTKELFLLYFPDQNRLCVVEDYV